MRIWNSKILKCPVCRAVQPASVGQTLPNTNHALLKVLQNEQLQKKKANVLDKLKVDSLAEIDEVIKVDNSNWLGLHRIASLELIYEESKEHISNFI